MIGIEIISSTSFERFGERLEAFLNSYPTAKILMYSIRGIEGGKGFVAVLSYDKKEEPTISVTQKKVDAEAELKAAQKAEARKKAAEQLKIAQEELDILE